MYVCTYLTRACGKDTYIRTWAVIEIRKDQKLVGWFFEERIFYRLLTTVPLKCMGNLANQSGFWLAIC